MPPAIAQNSQQAQQNLQSFGSSMQSPGDAMNAANAQFGVSQQQQQVQGLRTAVQNTGNLLNQVAPGVMGRTANSLVTSAQANRQIQNEQAPIATQLGQQSQAYDNANQDLQTSLQQAGQMANTNLAGQAQKQSYLQSVYENMYGQEQADRAYQEQVREANMLDSRSRAANAAAAGASPTFNKPGSNGFTTTTDKSGGIQFLQGAKPITAFQYVQGQGGNWQDLAQILSTSKNPGDAQIVRDMMSGMNQNQLTQKYPYVFGVR